MRRRRRAAGRCELCGSGGHTSADHRRARAAAVAEAGRCVGCGSRPRVEGRSVAATAWRHPIAGARQLRCVALPSSLSQAPQSVGIGRAAPTAARGHLAIHRGGDAGQGGGVVVVEAVILPNGSVGDVTVVESVDALTAWSSSPKTSACGSRSLVAAAPPARGRAQGKGMLGATFDERRQKTRQTQRRAKRRHGRSGPWPIHRSRRSPNPPWNGMRAREGDGKQGASSQSQNRA